MKPNFSPYSRGQTSLAELAELLQKVAVQHLAADELGGELVEEDIDVIFSYVGSYDRQSKDVVITITADYFPSRAVNRDWRLTQFKEDMRASGAFHRDTTVGFWLLLPESAWQE